MTFPTFLEQKKFEPMTKNDSYDQISPYDETDSFSEVARKSGGGFAARARDHDETGNLVAQNFGELKAQRLMNPAGRSWLFIRPQDWTWWVWLVTACLLLMGLMGMPDAFLAALLLLIAQSVLFFARERAFKAFPVQLRLAYTLLLIICFFPPIRWLFWLPTVGTFALVIFGYCLMARMLSLLPWNRTEPITADLLRRTFLSRPRLLDRGVSSVGCGASLCSIEAQVEPGTGQNFISGESPYVHV
jgi:hypothetical protein